MRRIKRQKFRPPSARIIWPIFISILLLFLSGLVRLGHAAEFKYSGRLSPGDYLLGSQEQHRDPVFDQFRVIDLSASVGVGSDCGKIDFSSTLKASLGNVLDSKYFGDVGKNILAGSPMLLACYFSPTWCAILKHSQVNANWMSQMRLDQCSLVDKYVDSRVEDYYQERQSCVHRSIEANGGNMEQAMQSCQGNGIWDTDLTNWAGSKNGAKATTNRLIDSSAKWAGFDSPEARGPIDLVKSFVGDTVISKGSVSVEYGPQNNRLTPRTYLQSLEKTTYSKLCDKIMKKVDDAGPRVPLDQVVTEADLKDVNNDAAEMLVDRQTIRAMAYMNPKQRDRACKKLSDAAAMTLFSNDVNRSLDLMTTLSQNPNLPPQRKQEIQDKRTALKEQIEMTIELQKQRSEPLNAVLSQIHEEGVRLQSESVGSSLTDDANTEGNHNTDVNLLDCSDDVLCQKGGE